MTDAPATDLHEIHLNPTAVEHYCLQLGGFTPNEVRAIQFIAWNLALRLGQPCVSFAQFKLFLTQWQPRIWLTQPDIDAYCGRSLAAADRFVQLFDPNQEVHP